MPRNGDTRAAFNTQQVNFLKEIYSKEDKYRNEFLDRVEAAERAAGGAAFPPEDDDAADMCGACDESPSSSGRGCTVSSQTRQPIGFRNEEEAMQAEISKNLWKRVNPGYLEPRKEAMKSTGNTTYVYEPDEIEPVSREHFRRRDKFTQYVEASSRYSLLMKAKAAQGGAPSPKAAPAKPAAPKPAPVAPVSTGKPASA